jgi:hypothetical protein
MADKQYVRIPAKDLPEVFYIPNDYNAPENGGNNVYFARYRVVSEDGRLSSRWSQRFEIPTQIYASNILLQESEWEAVTNSNVLSITWNVDRLVQEQSLFVKKFHVYVRFHSNGTIDPWTFMQETSNTNFSTIMPPDKNKADVAVLIPTYRGLDAGTTLPIDTDSNPDVPISPADLFPESVLFVGTDV